MNFARALMLTSRPICSCASVLPVFSAISVDDDGFLSPGYVWTAMTAGEGNGVIDEERLRNVDALLIYSCLVR